MTASVAPAPRRKLATGVYCVSNRGSVLPEQLACAVEELVEHRTAAVLLLATSATPARSALAHQSQLELGLTPPMIAWLSEVRQVAALEVPLPLRRALRCFRALVLPIATPVLHFGSLVVPEPASPSGNMNVLERLTADFALRLDVSQRRELLAQLAREQESVAPESRPQPRVSSLPPVSSRRTA